MNEPINTGGGAFPVPDVAYPNGQVQYGWPGMTLRDWFAGQALSGWYTGTGALPHRDHLDGYAADFYAIADAMLTAREAK